MYGKLFFVLCAVTLTIAASAPQYQSPSYREEPAPYSLSEIQSSPSYAPKQPDQELAVQVKDPAYAPTYGYEGYNQQTGYEGYLAPAVVAAPESPEYAVIGHEESGPFSFLTSLFPVTTAIFSVLEKVSRVVLSGAVAVIVGMFITLGFCTFTPFCTVSFSPYGRIQEEVRSFMTPQGLASATEFVKSAISKYQKMQVRSKAKPENRRR